MAKKKNKDEKKGKRKKVKKAKSPSVLWFLLVLTIAATFQASAILFGILMLPTFIARILDRHEPKTLAITVGAMNLAGMSAAWFELMERGHEVDTALQMAFDPANVFTAYGAAFFGLVIYLNITPLVANMRVRRARGELRTIAKEKAELITSWGQEVTGSVKVTDGDD